MFAIQPLLLPEYFISKKHSSQDAASSLQNVYKYFFLSWEDALWHLLKVYQVALKATILLPNFFCGDVIQHMRDHDLRIQHYLVNDRLEVDEQDFIKQLRQQQPQLVVIFHPVGITSNLFKNTKKWMSLLQKDVILIEDCVHRVIDASDLRRQQFLHKRHFMIDSLRKVAPIQGSFLYSTEIITMPSSFQHLMTLPYRIGVLTWWIVMQLFLLLAHYSSWQKLELFANLLAERAMLVGYRLIGKNYTAAPGFSFFRKWVLKLNHDALAQKKIHQYARYDQALRGLLSNVKEVALPVIDTADYGCLRAYPLVVTDLKKAAAFLNYCRSNGLLLRYELNDGPWSQFKKAFYLPMGLQVSNATVEQVINLMTHFFSNSR